jgi:hypothetical protein
VTKGVSKKLQRDDLLRKKRMQAGQAWPTPAAAPPRAIPPSGVGRAKAVGAAPCASISGKKGQPRSSSSCTFGKG